MKKISLILICLLAGVTTACAHKSVFKIEADQNKSHVFQYCRGQQWGYAKRIDAKTNSPYLGVFLENDIHQETDVIILNIVIESPTALDLSFKNRLIQIQRSGKVVHSKPSNFWIIRQEKQIWQRYSSSDYSYKPVEGKNNQWQVRKKKYGGFLGEMAFEDPFLITLTKYPNEEIKNDKISVAFDQENINEVYVLDKIVVSFEGKKSVSSEIVVRTPEFIANGTLVPEAVFTFHYDREKLIEEMKDSGRCASLDEIFRAARNKDSWSWFGGCIH